MLITIDLPASLSLEDIGKILAAAGITKVS